MSLYAPEFANPGPPLDRVRLPRHTPTRTSRRSGSTRWCSRGAGRSAARATATSRCGRGGPRTGARTTDPAIFTHGLAQPFDLVADGGADNVWLTQVGDAVAVPGLRGVPRRRARPPGAGRGPARRRRAGRRLRRRPTSRRPRARVSFGTTGPLTVKGADVALDTGKRYDNPWALADFGASAITIADTAGALKLDFAHGSRVTSVTGR